MTFMINKHLQEKFKGKSKYKLPFYNKAVQESSRIFDLVILYL